jgi:iron complex outermembrane recepter protein
MKPYPNLSVIALATSALCLACSNSAAQTQLDEVTVSAGSRTGAGAAGQIAQPSAQLSGTGLVLKGNSSLGEVLNGTPGVSSTYFGPVASRPVIRGMDGDRVRILSNAADNLDVSGLSYDHAVAIDPLVIERIELFRGPAALRYGGNGLGGVVNLLDGRIPREAISAQ